MPASLPLPSVATPRRSSRPTATGSRPFDEIVARVAQVLDIPPSVVSGRCRGSRQASFARHVAMYLAHVLTGASYERIASRMGRDRSTVMYGVQRIETLREDPRVERLLFSLEWSLSHLKPDGGRS